MFHIEFDTKAKVLMGIHFAPTTVAWIRYGLSQCVGHYENGEILPVNCFEILVGIWFIVVLFCNFSFVCYEYSKKETPPKYKSNVAEKSWALSHRRMTSHQFSFSKGYA